MANSINVKFPLRKSAHGAFQTNTSTIDAVKDDLRLLILTNYGERPIHYDFGANLRSIIFEQGPDVEQKITDAIQAAVEKWMPFVILNSIKVSDSSTNSVLQSNEIRVTINFSVNNIEGVLEQRVSA